MTRSTCNTINVNTHIATHNSSLMSGMEAATPRAASKRAPTTPLSLVNASYKRKLQTKSATKDSPSSIAYHVPMTMLTYKKEMLDSKLNTYILEQRLQMETETKEFLELERKAYLGTL